MGWGEGDPRWDVPFSSHDGGSAGVHRCPITLKSNYTGDNIQLEFYFIFFDFCAACQFSIAAVPKYNLVALTQHSLLPVGPKPGMDFTVPKLRCCQGGPSIQVLGGKKSLFLPFPVYRGCPDSLAVGPLTPSSKPAMTGESHALSLAFFSSTHLFLTQLGNVLQF